MSGRSRKRAGRPSTTPGHAVELSWAGDSYVLRAAQQMTYGTPLSDEGVPVSWPWSREFWKPAADPVRNLVKAGALIAAAIDAELASRPKSGGSENG